MSDPLIQAVDARTLSRERRLVFIGDPLPATDWRNNLIEVGATIQQISEPIAAGPHQGSVIVQIESSADASLYLVPPAVQWVLEDVQGLQSHPASPRDEEPALSPVRDRGLADRPSGNLPPSQSGSAPGPSDPDWLGTAPEGVPCWEYLTTFLEADARKQADFLQASFKGASFPKYAPEALMPTLMALGGAGWELVHMEPVYPGDNRDVMTHHGGQAGYWSHTYFCVFKRPRRW